MSDPAAGAAEPPAWRAAELLDGFLTTQLLYVAARLGIADVLADGPQSAEAIARATGARPELLVRVLRGLCLEDVLAEHQDGRFALTPLGACLRDGVPGSLRGAAIARGELYYRAAAGLLRAVKEGGTAFERVYGERFFDYLGRDREREAVFQASMTGRATQEADDVVAGYDFGEVGRLVDVGGGHGILLRAILRAAPRLHAVLVDREDVVAEARRSLEADGFAERCECVAGDFFASLPPGADAYLLSRVIHDWDDADAERILGVCREAMAPSSRLLLVEAVLPELARARPAAIRMDLHMLVLLGARERTEVQLRRLLEAAGLRVRRVVPTRSPAGLQVIEATVAGSA